MTTTIISGLILLSVGLCYVIVQQYFKLRGFNKENDRLTEETSNLEQKYSTLNNEHSKLKKIHSDSEKKQAKEMASFKKKQAKEKSDMAIRYEREMTKLAGEQANDKLNSIKESDS